MVNNFCSQISILPKDIKSRLYSTRKELVMNEMYTKHPKMYSKISKILENFIDQQLTLIQKDKEEILYFMGPDEMTEDQLNQKLLKDHNSKLEYVLKEEIEQIPPLVIQHAQTQMKNILEGVEISKEDQELEIAQNYDDVQEEWYSACLTTQETIYKEEITFWDRGILEGDVKLIDRVLEIFLLAQKLKSQKEVDDLTRCYFQLTKWIENFTQWRELDEDHYTKLLEKHQKAIENFNYQSSDPCFGMTREFDMKSNFSNYNFKFIVAHICMFLTQNVSSSRKFSKGYYNASYTLFLRSFIKGFFPSPASRKIIRSIEKAMGDFNLLMLKYEYQDPTTASQNLIHKDGKTLDLSSFVNQLSSNEDDFDEYLANSNLVDEFGSKEVDLKKEQDRNLKTKSRLLISYMKLIAEIKDNEVVKPKFELLSPLCPSSKHISISIGGLRGDSNGLTEKWEKYLSSNKALTVYAFRWKTKGLMPSFGDFLPTLESLIDITSIVSKVKLAYNVIKVPVSTREKFMDCIELAKGYGKLLAHALMFQFPFVNQSVSLFGFSMGAAVLFSCLEELHHKKANNIIQNVYFIGGTVDSSDSDKIAKVLTVVRGTVYNYYSEGDKTLKLFKTVTLESPIGMKPLLKIDSDGKNDVEKERIDDLRNHLRIVNVNTSAREIDGENYKDDFERNWPQLIDKIMI